MTVNRDEETKTYIIFETPVHRVKVNTDEMDRWIEKFEKSGGTDTYRSFVIFLQKKIKPITEAVINGEVYQDSFNEILNYILTKEVGVDTIKIEGNLEDYEKQENKESEQEMDDEEYRKKLEEDTDENSKR